MWLLLVIHLQFAPTPHVVHTELVGTFVSEQNCKAKVDWIFKESKAMNKKIPATVNFGCMPMNGRKA